MSVKRYAGNTPSGRDAHHDTPLGNMAVMAFNANPDYIASRLFPVVPVDKQYDRYYIIDKDTWLRVPTTLRAPKTSARQISFRVSSDGYFADNYALRHDNAVEDLANADRAIMLRENSTKVTVQGLLRDYETRVANATTSGTNLGSYVSLSGGTKWGDYANSDPLSDVTTGHAFIRQLTGLSANTLVLDSDTVEIVRRHPMLLDMYKYTSGGQLGMPQLADAFKVQTILIGSAIKNNALEGAATASITNIWGNSAILAHVEQGVSLQTMTFGVSMRWSNPEVGAPFDVTRYMDPDPSKKVEWVEAGYYQDEKIVAKDLAYGILSTL